MRGKIIVGRNGYDVPLAVAMEIERLRRVEKAAAITQSVMTRVASLIRSVAAPKE